MKKSHFQIEFKGQKHWFQWRVNCKCVSVSCLNGFFRNKLDSNRFICICHYCNKDCHSCNVYATLVTQHKISNKLYCLYNQVYAKKHKYPFFIKYITNECVDVYGICQKLIKKVIGLKRDLFYYLLFRHHNVMLEPYFCSRYYCS